MAGGHKSAFWGVQISFLGVIGETVSDDSLILVSLEKERLFFENACVTKSKLQNCLGGSLGSQKWTWTDYGFVGNL